MNQKLKIFAPFYWATFLQGLVFWYAIEKLYVTTELNISAYQIGLAVVAVSIVMLLLEFPSGVLADRWSRKGTMIIANIFLSLSALALLLADSFTSYLFVAILWGAFFAFYSGVYQAIVYDLVIEKKLPETDFDKVMGNINGVHGLGLVLGSIFGGFISGLVSFESVFILSTFPPLLSAVVLFFVYEPQTHKQAVRMNLLGDIKEVLSYIKEKNVLQLLVFEMVLFGTLFTLTFEFNQLYYIAIGLPIVLFGIANASLTGAFVAGGTLARKLRYYGTRPFYLLLILLPFVAFLQFVVRFPVGFALPSLLAIIFVTLDIRFQRYVNKRVSPNHRTALASAIGTIGRCISIPASLLFGWFVSNADYHVASILVVILTLIISLIGLRILTMLEQPNG